MTFTLSGEFIFLLVLNALAIGVAWGVIREQIKTLFNRIGVAEDKHDKHADKMDQVCHQVAALVAKLDILLGPEGPSFAPFSRGRANA